MQSYNEDNNLKAFFEMIDLIEDDISEILDDENNQLSGYECLVISFNCLTLFCRQVGMDFSQIEDYYNESEVSQSGQKLRDVDRGLDTRKFSEVEAFNLMLEDIENTLTAFEERCKKTEELFDEWNCVFIMYKCLRKYCDETKLNYDEILKDVLNLQSNLKNNEKTELDDKNT